MTDQPNQLPCGRGLCLRMVAWLAQRRGLLRTSMLVPLLLAGALANAAPVPIPVLLVSEEWADYTNRNGTGLAWELMRKVYGPVGYRVVTRTEPYIRAVGLVQRHEADAWVGSYRDETQSVYPHWNYDNDHIYALGLSSRPSPDINLLGQYKLAWVRGYEYQQYLPSIKRYTQVQRRAGVLAMLDLGRADYYIDALNEIQGMLKASPRQSSYKVTHLIDLPLYLGFADTPKGRQLRDLFDQRMDELVPSGQLRELFNKWHQPYPFEAQTPAKSR